MTYTAKEVEEAVEAWEEAEGDGFWSEVEWSDGLTLRLRDEKVPVSYEGGDRPREGGGEDVSAVIRIGKQLFEKDGYYASHYGTDWDGDVYEVRAAQKTITVYEPIKETA